MHEPERYRPRAPLLAATTAVLALGLAAPAAAEGDTIIVARSVDADSLDPHATTTTQSRQAFSIIYDRLLGLDEATGLHPNLATDWSVSDDGLAYRFTIRDGVTCHDGSTFDAEAVKFNIERAIAPETNFPGASVFGEIDNVAVEGSDVVVTMAKPNGAWLVRVAGAQSLVCQSSVAEDGTFTPIGTGAYKLVEWIRNDRLVFEANADYTNYDPLIENPGAPHIPNLIYRVIPEAPARMAALRTDEVHFAEPALEEAAALNADDAYRIYGSDLTGQQVFAAFLWRIPPFDDVRVRQAVGHAVDRELYAEVAFEGLVEASYCPIAPTLFSADQEECKEWGQTFDPDRARELLAEAGFGPDNPIRAKLSVHRLPGWDLMHQIMQQHLADVGIEVEIETREVAAFFQHMTGENTRTDGEPVVWTMGQSGSDPGYLHLLWRTPGLFNMGLNEDLDAILDAQSELFGEAREAKLKEAQHYLLENAYAIPLVSPGWNWLMASKANLDGFRHAHTAELRFNDVRFVD